MDVGCFFSAVRMYICTDVVAVRISGTRVFRKADVVVGLSVCLRTY